MSDMSVARRILGRTGLSVSEIGFGCGTTAGLMIHGSRALRQDAVAHALSLGINYFDTAPIYGDNLSEINLGMALRALGAKPVVATKVALGEELLGDIAGAVARSVEGSLERLGLDRLPLIQLHNRVGESRAAKAEFGSGALLSVEDVLGPGGVIEGFRALRERGLVQFCGCSAYGGDMDAMGVVVDSGAFDAIVVNYSALNDTAWRAAPGMRDYRGIGERAARKGMGVIALRVLEGGALTGAPPAATAQLPPDHAAMVRRASGLQAALSNDAPLTQTAIRFALSNPDVSTVLVGFSTIGQIAEAAENAAHGPLPPAILHKIEELRV